MAAECPPDGLEPCFELSWNISHGHSSPWSWIVHSTNLILVSRPVYFSGPFLFHCLIPLVAT